MAKGTQDGKGDIPQDGKGDGKQDGKGDIPNARRKIGGPGNVTRSLCPCGRRLDGVPGTRSSRDTIHNSVSTPNRPNGLGGYVVEEPSWQLGKRVFQLHPPGTCPSPDHSYRSTRIRQFFGRWAGMVRSRLLCSRSRLGGSSPNHLGPFGVGRERTETRTGVIFEAR